MMILVDADACPKPIKEILYRASKRLSIPLILFANKPLYVPPSPSIQFVLVGGGFDVADNVIVERSEPGDLIITADIPLAAAVIAKGASALNPRGEFYTPENIQQTLTMRNFMATLRETGQVTGGPAPLNAKDHQAFANALDRFLSSSLKR
ncbi:YaiI/YqxD family protein [Candidatus Berkiella aquae]|uniref:UPF0178 protein HT99x_004020 n=1 Tax=Candidatus Berkiella aquae TaxID=295108 RepID=A0A0Q9YLS0_9GAMM|nr:YaiI/YqxD family protein [Candidatus Berkiella aquae]MCS5710584.1 YaiI/YqxD family protein [Candidatus Berkiella aquae]